MKLNSYYPVIATSNVPAAKAFFEQNFGFEARFAADWYVHLVRPGEEHVALAILGKDHESIPLFGRGVSSAGVLLNFEVEDVDAEYARLKASGSKVLLELRSEAWGQRHFILQGPEGVMVDVIQVIPPTGEFAAAYTDGAAASV